LILERSPVLLPVSLIFLRESPSQRMWRKTTFPLRRTWRQFQNLLRRIFVKGGMLNPMTCRRCGGPQDTSWRMAFSNQGLEPIERLDLMSGIWAKVKPGPKVFFGAVYSTESCRQEGCTGPSDVLKCAGWPSTDLAQCSLHIHVQLTLQREKPGATRSDAGADRLAGRPPAVYCPDRTDRKQRSG